MRSLILVMSLMGSYIFVFYLLFRPFLKNFFPVKVRISFIIVSSMYYLLPFPIFKNYYYDVLNVFFDIDSFTHEAIYKVSEPIRIISNQSIVFSKLNSMVLIVSLSLIVVFIVAATINFKSYQSTKREIFFSSIPIDNTNVDLLKDLYKNSTNKINIRLSNRYKPLTIGYFNPLIVLPQDSSVKEQIFILKHEMAHLNNRDFMLKLLMYLVICLHWFNPLVYIMLYELNALVEYRADEICTADLNKEECDEYRDTVLKFSKNNKKSVNSFINGFSSNNESKIKERMKEMKKNKKYNKFNSIISGVLLAVAVLSCSALVFAYEDAPIYYDNDVNSDADIFFSEEKPESVFDEGKLISPDKIFSDLTFIDDEGNTYSIDNVVRVESDESKALCNHSYVSGTIQEHTKLSDGGCTLKIYNGQRCKKCGTVIKGSLISSTTYTVCPH